MLKNNKTIPNYLDNNLLCNMKLLFVCIGNICRSPIAEGVMKKLCAEHSLPWHIESAGTSGYHQGEPPHLDSIRVCKENEIDISEQKSRPLKRTDFTQYDIIYTLATDVHKSVLDYKPENSSADIRLFLDALYPGENRSVKDPWYGSSADYEDVFEEIHQCCNAILNQLHEK